MFFREVKDLLQASLDHLQPGSAAEVNISKALTLIERRQKLIRLADTSIYGWATVTEYATHELADDEEDGNKIMRAENRAGRKVKQRRATLAAASNKRAKREQFDSVGDRSGSHLFRAQSFFTANRSQSGRNGGCFTCGSFNHWKATCPARKGAPSTASKPAQC